MRCNGIVLVMLLGLPLAGCATIIEGTTQKISVNTPPASGAVCVLTNGRGSWSLTSPGSVDVKRSTTDLIITCKKEGWADTVGTLHSRTSDGASATALLLGPIGIGVDAASGATFHYPGGIELPMAAAAIPASANVAQPDRAPKDSRTD